MIASFALAGCSSTTTEPPDDPQPWKTTEVPEPAATIAAVIAPESSQSGDPVPHISVEITTEAPKPDPAPAKVERSVTRASADYASSLVSLANQARADAGVGKLSVNSCAQKQAVARAARALAKAHLEHEPLPDCGFRYVGENLARHYGSPQDMHDAWMNSQGHHDNIVSPNYTGIGVGCVAYSRNNPQKIAARADDVGGHVCAQVFVG